MKEKKRLLIKLFLSTFYLSAFTFGGGYVIVTLMKRKFVDDYHWISEEEMLDFTAIAQSAPGPIAINGAIVVGYRLAGIPGVITAITATVIPPFITISLISVFYQVFRTNFIVSQMLEGMQAGIGAVIAMIASAGISILTSAFWSQTGQISLAGTHFDLVCIFLVSLFLLRKCKANPILVMTLAGLLKVAFTLFTTKNI